MYGVGETHDDKAVADRVFGYNLTRIIQANTDNKYLYRLRMRGVHHYVDVVTIAGGPWFWADKNKPEEIGIL